MDAKRGAVRLCYFRENKTIINIFNKLPFAISAPDGTVACGCCALETVVTVALKAASSETGKQKRKYKSKAFIKYLNNIR